MKTNKFLLLLKYQACDFVNRPTILMDYTKNRMPEPCVTQHFFQKEL